MTGNKKLIYAALFAALCCVITMYPKFPTLFGYIHAGDALVLLAAYVLGPLWGSLAAALGSSLVNVLLAMTISNVPWYCRIIRSSVLGVTGQTYIEAARSCGTSDFQIFMTHVLPNAMGPIIVQATMGIGGAIISAAGISFVGMGIQPPAPEWGAMLNEAKTFMTMYPYMVVFPGLAIGLTALSMNLMGDGLRDALDPKLKD